MNLTKPINLTEEQQKLYSKYVNCVIPKCQDTTVLDTFGIYNFEDNKNLYELINNITNKLLNILNKHKPVILTSMEKDSIVVLDIVRKINPNIDAYFFYHKLPQKYRDFQSEFDKLKEHAIKRNVNVINLGDSSDREDWFNYLKCLKYDLFLTGFYPSETIAKFRKIMLDRGQYYFSDKYNIWFYDVIFYFSVKNVFNYINKYIPDFVNVVRPMKCIF